MERRAQKFSVRNERPEKFCGRSGMWVYWSGPPRRYPGAACTTEHPTTLEADASRRLANFKPLQRRVAAQSDDWMAAHYPRCQAVGVKAEERSVP